MKRQFIKRRIVFFFIAPILFLVLVEATARTGTWLYWRHRYVSMTRSSDDAKLKYDRDRGWAWEEGQQFRGRDGVEKEKAPDHYRIIAVGDSCTRGAGVHPAEAYPWKLEERLRRSKPPLAVEVLNAGVNGYSTGQMAEYLERELLSYSPDLVVAYANPFDRDDRAIEPGEKIAEAEWIRKRAEARPAPYVEKAQSFLFRFKSYYLLRKLFQAFRAPSAGPLFQTDLRRSANLTRMRGLCDAAGVKMMIVEYVVKRFENGRDFISAPDENRRRTWEAPFVPIFPKMQESGFGPDDLFHDAVHPTPLGHDLIAEEITRKIRSESLIENEAARRQAENARISHPAKN